MIMTEKTQENDWTYEFDQTYDFDVKRNVLTFTDEGLLMGALCRGLYSNIPYLYLYLDYLDKVHKPA